jgi:hypothetical protein
MANYKFPRYLSQSNDAAFDAILKPGAITPISGIYRCEGCGHEIGSVAGNPLPPENHHQHATWPVPILWRLVVSDGGKP